MAGIFDKLFPAAKPLKAAAQGTEQAPPKPIPPGEQGIDVAAEAQKAAARAKAAPVSTQPATSTPITDGTAKRDHYAPRGNQ
jgi:hypothetical protein